MEKEKGVCLNLPETEQTFEQLLEKEFACLIPSKPLTAGEIVSIKNAFIALLEQKIRKKKRTSEFLEVKAKTDVIYRTMWLMSNSEIDALNETIKELRQ